MMEPGTPEFVIVFSGGIMILMLLSLFGNIVVCFAVYYSRNLRARVNYFIVSLAASDILIASVAMPTWLVFEITQFNNMSHDNALQLYKFYMFIDILGGIASIANLTAISYERLWSICSPLKHRRYLTNFTAVLLIIGVWIYAIIVAGTTIGFQEWEWIIVYNAVVGFFLPLFLIFIAYVGIFITVNRSPRNVVSAQDNSRINKTIIIIIGLFVLCWAPHFISSILSKHCKSCYWYFLDNLWMRSFFKWLHYVNSCVNPLVYGIANAQYKDAFKAVFKKLCLRRLFTKQPEDVTQPVNESKFLNRTKPSDKEKLQVELTPEEKYIDGPCGSIDARNDSDSGQYLPGDYRAIPCFQASKETRWLSEAPESLIGNSLIDDTAALKKALLNPESLRRTSYL